jgi:hypothetical protein
MVNKIHLYGNILSPKTKDKYFFTIELNKKGDSISFDNTIKGHRILKQINAGKFDMSKGKIKEEWEMYHFINGKLIEKIHEKWIDKGKEDIINGIIWKQIWEIPTPKEIDKRLIQLNNFLWKNKQNLNSKKVIKRVKKDSEKLNKFALKINKQISL